MTFRFGQSRAVRSSQEVELEPGLLLGEAAHLDDPLGLHQAERVHLRLRERPHVLAEPGPEPLVQSRCVVMLGRLPNVFPGADATRPPRPPLAPARGPPSVFPESAAGSAIYRVTGTICAPAGRRFSAQRSPRTISCSRSRPSVSASGRGGQPGTYTSTGMTLSTPLHTE